MRKPERSAYKPTDFLEWREAGTLNVSPKFQRRRVWSHGARAYFIDSMLREMPVPPIYLREAEGKDPKKPVREVVDGQQRIHAVLDFIDGKYSLTKSLGPEWGGKQFDELTATEQASVLQFSFSCEVFGDVSDEYVFAVFERLNTYSVKLNAQELRNGKYFGYFRQTAYELAREHLAIWRQLGVFTEHSIARMSEVELTSELMIAQIAGMQDKKSSINDFYAQYDEEFGDRDKVAEGFRRTMDTIVATIGVNLASLEFRRSPLFYSLFCAVFHQLAGMSGQSAPSRRRALTKSSARSLRDAVGALSEKITSEKNDEPVAEKYRRFVTACLRQTDNIQPRQTRFDFLTSEAF